MSGKKGKLQRVHIGNNSNVAEKQKKTFIASLRALSDCRVEKIPVSMISEGSDISIIHEVSSVKS